MKLLKSFKDQLTGLGALRRVWFTSFNINTDFIETYLLPTILDMEIPRNRMDYESIQMELVTQNIDLRIFCDKRMLDADQYKRTALAIHPVSLRGIQDVDGLSDESLFHPKVVMLEDTNGRMIVGAGSANLTVSGWGRNQEVFCFRTVSTDDQFRDVTGFFEKLAHQQGIEFKPRIKRAAFGNDTDWRFVHSFQKTPFVNQLFDDVDANRLTVWSPYLSENLPQLVESIRSRSGNSHLRFLVVPDRIEGRFIRTPWSDALAGLLSRGDIAFCTQPGKRPDNLEMIHAKVWLAAGSSVCRLAIGSWNFTTSGCSSFERRNIEAGILMEYEAPVNIAGDVISVSADDFASKQLLEEESLQLAETLPFDLQVSYDWHEGTYSVEGSLFQRGQENQYVLKLPGVKKAIALEWGSYRKQHVWPLKRYENSVPDNEALLSDHSYAIERKGEIVYRGLILELGQQYRRAQTYETLQDLLGSLIGKDDPTTTDKVTLRGVLGSGAGPDEALPIPKSSQAIDSLSYFRLFYAMEQFRLRFQSVKTKDELEKWLFSYPGCVQELASKARQHIENDAGTVFGWFLAQEVNSLYGVALECHERCREPHTSKQPPQVKWSTLQVKVPKLPADIAVHRRYLNDIKRECGYGHA